MYDQKSICVVQSLKEGVVYPVVVYTTGKQHRPYEMALSLSNPRGMFPQVLRSRQEISKKFAELGFADRHKIVLIVEGDKNELSRIMQALNKKKVDACEDGKKKDCSKI